MSEPVFFECVPKSRPPETSPVPRRRDDRDTDIILGLLLVGLCIYFVFKFGDRSDGMCSCGRPVALGSSRRIQMLALQHQRANRETQLMQMATKFMEYFPYVLVFCVILLLFVVRDEPER